MGIMRLLPNSPFSCTSDFWAPVVRHAHHPKLVEGHRNPQCTYLVRYACFGILRLALKLTCSLRKGVRQQPLIFLEKIIEKSLDIPWCDCYIYSGNKNCCCVSLTIHRRRAVRFCRQTRRNPGTQSYGAKGRGLSTPAGLPNKERTQQQVSYRLAAVRRTCFSKTPYL
jgi:hypothetical protein